MNILQKNSEAQVLSLAENVRHNEKGIDRVERELQEFRKETNQRFAQVYADLKDSQKEVDQRFDKVDQKFEKVNEAITTNRNAIAALSNQQTIGFVVLAGLIVFQDQVISLVQMLRLAAN